MKQPIESKFDGMGISRAVEPQPRNAFNPDMVITAREARRMSQTALAEEIGISQQLLAKWETGRKIPNPEQIDHLSSALDVQSDLFFVDRSRRLATMSDFYHRALARAKRTDVKAIHARCSIIDIQIDRLLNSVEIPEDRIPDIDPSSVTYGIEEIASEARTRMGIGSGPILNLVAEIERCGAIIIDRGLEVDEVDALCRWVPELPKLFYLNGAKPADRCRWSLAHELGHTVMHFGRSIPAKLAEDQANSFASAFLMPADEFRRDFHNGARISDLAAIKRKWRISMQAAARRAWSIGLIDNRRYKNLCIQISRNGWRKQEPITIEGETPTTFLKLIKAHLNIGYSTTELAILLMVSESAIDRMITDANSPNYDDHGVRLRIVRDD